MAQTLPKPARKTSEVPAKIKTLLNRGELETRNLVEWLVVDQGKLVNHILPQLKLTQHKPAFTKALKSLKTPTAPKQTQAVGLTFLEVLEKTPNEKRIQAFLITHSSDVVRSWAAFTIGHKTHTTLAQKLKTIKPLANDPHFGVRELAWLALRHEVLQDPTKVIKALIPWVKNKNENTRRFATELTRPRGVWCAHIPVLKEDPTPGFVLLEPLKADPSKYVRDSVANWLNDASKTKPTLVKKLCARWKRESKTEETKYIIGRALRTQKAKA